MTREEITRNIVNLEEAARDLKEAWLLGDIKQYHKVEYDILATLKAAKERLKNDLYIEAVS